MLRTLEQEFPIGCLEPFRELLTELSGLIPGKSVLLSADELTTSSSTDNDSPQIIGVWVSEPMSLLFHRIHRNGSYWIQAVIDPQSIKTQLQQLQSQNYGQSLDRQIKQAIALCSQSQDSPSAQVTQQLLITLIQKSADNYLQPPASDACQAVVDAALTQQLAQEGLIYRVTAQIRQSLELPEILATAAEQVRLILDVDRFVIYQFESQPKVSPIEPLQYIEDTSLEADVQAQEPLQPVTTLPILDPHEPYQFDCMGTVTYESCRDSSISSTLHYREQYCWIPTGDAIKRYQMGQVLSSANTAETYKNSDCMLGFLQEMQVQAKLVVPVIVQSELWGLLIAHQCTAPREWGSTDITFVRQIAEHLSVAIAQSLLYHQLHEQKSTLELQVQQRTKELQDALIRVHAANQAKSEFLATMSHELRTPLTCVIGMSATLLRWSLGPLTDKQRSYLQTIHDSGEHLLDLINDILDLSNVEAGRASLNIGELSLSSLSHQSLQMLRDKAHASEIMLKAQIDLPTGSDRFMADSRRIKQILFNLLSNAIKFTPAGGQVILRVWRESNAAVFQVEDTGIGIPNNQQSLLFQKFQQLDTSYRRSYEGTGLGLALVKQFVDMHNGWIEVESDEGKGTRFTIEIPNQTARSPSGEEKSIELLPRMPLAGSRILLIEPHDEQAGFICDILTAAGYQVIWIVESGIGLPQVKILQPILVILEAELSDRESLAMIRKIRSSSVRSKTKILVLTSEHSSEQTALLLEAGADACLQKPINAEHLLHKVETILLTSTAQSG